MMNNMNVQGTNVMPLMMNFVTPTPIRESVDTPYFNYDEENQISYEMRLVGTRCLRHHGNTSRGGKCVSHCDPKNETDDSKSVR